MGSEARAFILLIRRGTPYVTTVLRVVEVVGYLHPGYLQAPV